MAQRKKRAAARRVKSAPRRKAHKTSKSAREKPTKRTVARLKPRKSLAKAKTGAKQAAPRKKVKPSSSRAAEAVIVDPIDLPSVATEATPVLEPIAPREQPGESPV
jgi:hypothetical protein